VPPTPEDPPLPPLPLVAGMPVHQQGSNFPFTHTVNPVRPSGHSHDRVLFSSQGIPGGSLLMLHPPTYGLKNKTPARAAVKTIPLDSIDFMRFTGSAPGRFFRARNNTSRWPVASPGVPLGSTVAEHGFEITPGDDEGLCFRTVQSGHRFVGGGRMSRSSYPLGSRYCLVEYMTVRNAEYTVWITGYILLCPCFRIWKN
jgi:hypothetical protein